MKTILRNFIFSAIFLVISFPAQAQDHSSDARLFGTLFDSSGAGVGQVQVTARVEGDANAQLWKTSSFPDGAYSLILPPGRYHVRFEREPFAARDLIVDLAGNQQRKLDVNLELERLSASVIVTAQTEPTVADQTTAPVSVITKEEIDARQSVSLPDALLFAPDIAIGRTGAEGGTASVFLNGGNSNFTKVLVDGTPINPPGGAVDFSSLTLDNIDKVEIVRGAESAIYGTDAVSGVIQLFTHRGSTRVPEFSVYGEGGNFASGRGGAEASGGLRSVGGSRRQRVVDVVAGDLLLDAVRRAAEEPGLRRRAVAGHLDEPIGRDAGAGERVAQCPPRLVRAGRSDRHRNAAESAHVGRGVAGTARQVLLLPVLEDQDGRLAADALRVAVDEAVEDEVARDGQSAAREAVDEREQPPLRNRQRHGRGL